MPRCFNSPTDKWMVVLFLLLIGSIMYSLAFTTYETFKSGSSTPSGLNTGKKLVLFYTETCPHCKAMLDDWNNAAKKVNTSGQIMIKINCSKNKDLATQYNITSYPTILLLSDGKMIKTYTGGRNASDFENYVKANVQ